jgi:hypothetical protein
MDLLRPRTRMLLEPIVAPDPQVRGPSGAQVRAEATHPKPADA